MSAGSRIPLFLHLMLATYEYCPSAGNLFLKDIQELVMKTTFIFVDLTAQKQYTSLPHQRLNYSSSA